MKWSESNMWPSMVTHTRNLCSAFIPSKVHTHSSEHTHTVNTHLEQWAAIYFCCARGAVGGTVPCSRAPQSWYWWWRECWLFTPPTYNPCRTWDSNPRPLGYESDSLTIRTRLPQKIVEYFKNNVPQCQIAKALQISSSTVHNIIKRFRETGEISVRKGQGRRPLFDARGLRALRRLCITHRHDSVIVITKWAQEYLQKPLSVNTIRRAICRCQLKLNHAKRKPYVNMVQKCCRVLWAKAHLKWTVSKCKSVLWSEESKFDILVGNHGLRVLRAKEEGDLPACYQRSVQKPASLMVWGA